MRNIQIERKLFELFGYQFLVFENFEDMDLNIDDKSIYTQDDPQRLVEIFAENQFYAIWSDQRRLNAAIICSCEQNLNRVIHFLKKIGMPKGSYSTFDCGLNAGDRVLYIPNPTEMQRFVRHLTLALNVKEVANIDFFRQKHVLKKKLDLFLSHEMSKN